MERLDPEHPSVAEVDSQVFSKRLPDGYGVCYNPTKLPAKHHEHREQ